MTCLLVNSFGAIGKASFDQAGALTAFCAAVPALLQGLEIAVSFPKAIFLGKRRGSGGGSGEEEERRGRGGGGGQEEKE